MLDNQLTWARKEFRWQVTVKTFFPLPKELKPTQVSLRNINVFDKEIHMIPNKDNNLTYWFFKTDSDCRAFMDHVRRFFNIEISDIVLL